ncbi:hypothetical protein ACFS5N_12025 [Mucilaginibacter ximonensis]|uniref:Uncharacterized protein n=1 Tax=Mucilaginibacter ximonensis TaxID=538021 RepID=A0ABW5YD36_9SPHI
MPHKIKYLMFLALLMFVAKPFVGFSLRYEHYFRVLHHRKPNILVKSFAKRKLEVSEDSEFSMVTIAKKLATPVLPTIMLLACALNIFLSSRFRQSKTLTYSDLAAITCSLHPPQPLYLLGGKLTI